MLYVRYSSVIQIVYLPGIRLSKRRKSPVGLIKIKIDSHQFHVINRKEFIKMKGLVNESYISLPF